MSIPKNLLYTKSHEWMDFTGENSAKIGLTDFAQKRMSSIVFVDLPSVGDTVTAGGRFADVESIKAVFEVFSPVSGTISAVNEEVAGAPERINEAPYDSWLIEVSDISLREGLMDANAYKCVCWTGDEEESEPGDC